MGSDLEHRVGGGVHDQIAGFHVLLAKFFNHCRAGPGRVCQNPSAGGFPKRLQHLVRKALGVGRQRIFREYTCHFPVAGGGVLTHGRFCHTAICGSGCHFIQSFHAFYIAKSQFDHIGNLQFFRLLAGGKGIDPHITEFLAVRQCADTKRVQND